MVVSEIQLYNLLKAKIGDREAEAFIEILEKKVEKGINERKDVLVAEIETKIAQSEARLTLRMFYFWLGQIAVIAGLLAYFFNK